MEKYRKSLNKLLVLGVLSLVGVVLPGYATEGVLGPPESGLGDTFGTWVEALEGRLTADSAWDFPFGAPKPADLNSRDLEIVLALRRHCQTGDLESLGSLVDKVARRKEPLPVQILFWQAYGFSLLQRNQACLSQLEILLDGNDDWAALENGQLVWVLTGTPDQLFLAGRKLEAASLYRRLSDSPVEQLNIWGNFQLGGAEFLARNFSEAGRRYNLVCESDKAGSWREHACEMASIAQQLDTLRTEGKGHGISANVVP